MLMVDRNLFGQLYNCTLNVMYFCPVTNVRLSTESRKQGVQFQIEMFADSLNSLRQDSSRYIDR